MRTPSETQKEILRHLSAARFYLPVKLNQPYEYAAESQYNEFLHHNEYELALECIEDLGYVNNGHAEEPLFWSELLAASQLMELTEHINLCYGKLGNCAKL